MNNHRDGDNGQVFFQSERVQCINGLWYFSVREEPAPIGPFESREDSELEVELYIRDLKHGVDPSVNVVMRH